MTITLNLRHLGLAALATALFGTGFYTGKGCPGVTPVPTPDVKPVDPVTPPKPQPPAPPADPGPFAGKEGLRLLVVYETGKVLSPKHQSALFGKDVQEYLARKCPKGVNSWPEFRMWDPDVDPQGHGEHWTKALAVPRTKLPFYVVGNGTSWEKGEVPADPAAFLTILKKYGGD